MRLTKELHLLASGANGLFSTDEGDCNVYLLETDVGSVFVDAGGGVEIENWLEPALEICGSLAAILITHTHYDHVAGLATIKAATGASLRLRGGCKSACQRRRGSYRPDRL